MTEKISSLIDGRVSGEELGAACGSLGADELRRLERYQLIGALMRGDCSGAAVRLCRNDTGARISERIAEEPRWLLRPAGRRRHARDPVRRGAAFFGGFAAAAALAAIAVMVVSPNWLGSPGAATAPVASVEEAAAPAGASPMDMDELNALLVEHGEFTGSAGLNGLVAYAKFVSHGSE